MPALVREFPDAKLVIVGDGPLRGALEQQCVERGVGGSVVFAGWSENVHAYMRDSDIFALPSTAEGFGLVLLEAWFNRLPAVCFDVPAPNEIVTHGVDGLLVPEQTAGALAEALASLLRNPRRMAGLGENGRRTYERDYTIDVMTRRTIQLYEELLARRAAA